MKGETSRRRLTAAVAGVSLVLAAVAVARSEDRVARYTVAAQGQPAAGTSDGSTYGNIQTTGQISADGAVAFNAHVVPPGSDPYPAYAQTTWVGKPGALQLLVRPGDAVPGKAAGTTFTTTGLALLTADGRAVLDTGGTGTSEMLWSGGGGAAGLTPLFEAGTQAPGLPAGVKVSSFLNVVANGAGQVGFVAPLGGTGVTLSNDRAYFIGSPSAVTAVARSGDSAPGFAAGVTLAQLPVGVTNPLNDRGQMLFVASVTGPGIDATNDKALYLATRDGGLTFVASAPAPDPMSPAFAIGAPALNNAGQLAYTWRRTLAGSGGTAVHSAGVVAGTPDHLTTIASRGMRLPGSSSSYFTDFYDPQINSAGQVAITAATTTDGSAGVKNAVLVGSAGGGGGLSVVAAPGMQAPGAAAGTVFDTAGSIAFNNRGQVVVAARLAGTGVVANVNDTGVWASVGDRLVPVVRRGDLLDLGGGQSGSYYGEAFAVRGGNGEDGDGRILNDLGQLVLTVNVIQSGQVRNGVFLFTLPSAIAGDADNDLTVSMKDFARFEAGFGKAGDRLSGDFNYDGVVDGQDFSILYDHFGQSFGGATVPMSEADRGTLEGFAAANGISVPEPAGLAVVLAGGVVLGGRRRRRVKR